jgi:hypothetical protein
MRIDFIGFSFILPAGPMFVPMSAIRLAEPGGKLAS